jgi:hypothetical protein
VVYSTLGSFRLTARGTGLKGYWFNPRDVHGSLGTALDVRAGASTFTPPDPGKDWVLWITDGSDLNSGATHPSTGATVVQIVMNR